VINLEADPPPRPEAWMPDYADDEEYDESYDLEVRGGLTVDQFALQLLLCSVSQSCYFASWMADTEYEVWRLLVEGGEWGRSDATAEQADLDEIRELSNRIGSWIVTDSAPGSHGPMRRRRSPGGRCPSPSGAPCTPNGNSPRRIVPGETSPGCRAPVMSCGRPAGRPRRLLG
jgi:hypothetical protein